MKQYISSVSLILVLIVGFSASIQASLRTLWSGKDALAFSLSTLSDEQTTKSLVFYDEFVTLYSRLIYHVFNDGLPGLIIGKNGWFFTREEWKYDRDSENNFEKNLAFIKYTQSSLSQYNVKLLIIPIPLKSEIYRDYTASSIPSEIAEKYDFFKKFLEDNSIHYCDLYPPFKNKHHDEKLFFKNDTHWTPYGADIAALETSKCLNTPYWKKRGYARTNGEILSHSGDLSSFLPLSDKEILMSETFQSYHYAEAENNHSASALFGDEEHDIALVGTSYSANPKWQFVGALQYNLSASILNFAKEAHGPFANMESYLAYIEAEKKYPKLVIWEIPQRYLLLSSSANGVKS